MTEKGGERDDGGEEEGEEGGEEEIARFVDPVVGSVPRRWCKAGGRENSLETDHWGSGV